MKLLIMAIILSATVTNAQEAVPVLKFSVDWSKPQSLIQSFGLGCGVTQFGVNPDVELTISGIYGKDFKFGSETFYKIKSVRIEEGKTSVIRLTDGSPSDNDINIQLVQLNGSGAEADITVDSGC